MNKVGNKNELGEIRFYSGKSFLFFLTLGTNPKGILDKEWISTMEYGLAREMVDSLGRISGPN